MAAKRGKSQARRNGGRGNGGGDHGLPLWAWGVLLGVLVAVGVLVVPKVMHGKGSDGFFRPAPNPDAQPAPVAEDDAVADDADAAPAKKPEADKPKGTQYDFYKLLPGNEVPMSDAEVAATARAEAARAATASAATPTPTPAGTTAPDQAGASTAPVATPKETVAATAVHAAPAPTAHDAAASPASVGKAADTPYLLQAGAFGASGDAEALKAKIALLGLGARVESAQLDGKTVFRVRMGPYGTASELADAKHKLAAGGLPAMAIRAR